MNRIVMITFQVGSDFWSRVVPVFCCLLGVMPAEVLGSPVSSEMVKSSDSSSSNLLLSVVSFNIRYQTRADHGVRNWKNRLPVALEAVNNLNPDIVGVQEALVGQLKDLKGGMKDYEVFGVGRDDAKSKGEHVSVFYRKSRFDRDVKESGHFWLSATPEKVASRTWGNGITRMCTWLRLVDRLSGRGIYVYNTHWDHRSQESREQAARLIASRIDQRVYKNEPVVLMGDFNAIETNPAVAYLTGEKVKLKGGSDAEQWQSPLVDVFDRLHPNQQNRRTFNQWIGKKDGFGKIDHIFVSAGSLLKEAAIVYHHREAVYPSDHYPVWVKVMFR